MFQDFNSAFLPASTTPRAHLISLKTSKRDDGEVPGVIDGHLFFKHLR